MRGNMLALNVGTQIVTQPRYTVVPSPYRVAVTEILIMRPLH